MKNNKKTFEILMLYVGCVVGAGFASGQETIQFFSRYGKASNLSICLMGLLFGVIALCILRICDRKKLVQFEEFQHLIAGKLMKKVFSICATMFMFICLSTMFAGCGALIEQGFGIKAIYGTVLFAILCYAVLSKGAGGIIKVNTILTLILVVGTILICIYIAFYHNTSASSTQSIQIANNIEAISVANTSNHSMNSIYLKLRYNWVVALLLYVSYNLITSKILLVTNSEEVRSRKNRIIIAVCAGGIFTLIGLLQNKIILERISMLEGVQIPILAIVMSLNNMVQYIYIITIILAMFTTAIATGWGLLIRSNKDQRKRALILIIAAIGFAQIGFSDLVANVYPVFGYVGLIEIILIVIYSWKGVRKNG